MPRDLEALLGGPPPPEITALGPDAVARLETLVRGAEQRQLNELAAALEHALRIVPRPVRPIIRKVVGA